MTDETSEPTEILSGPEPTVSMPSPPPAPGAPPPPPGSGAPAGEPGPWMAAPPPPPPGQDPGVPVRDAPPSPPPGPARAGRGRAGQGWAVDARRLGREPAWLLAVAGVLAAYVVIWLESVLDALRHQPGLSTQDRILELFVPGSIQWAALILLGVVVHSYGRRHLDPASGPLPEAAAIGLLVAAAGVAGAAGLGILVELANFGNGIDSAFIGIVGRLGALALSAAAGWWAWRDGPGLRS